MVNTVRQIALLRGINAGRARRVDMAQLRELLRGFGYSERRRYRGRRHRAGSRPKPGRRGQSNRTKLRRTRGRRGRNPLLDVATDPSKHLVAFLAGEPDPAGVRTLASFDFAPDQVRLVGREAYLWCPSGFLASPLSKVPWDKLFGVAVTMRNWNTVTRPLQLLGR